MRKQRVAHTSRWARSSRQWMKIGAILAGVTLASCQGNPNGLDGGTDLIGGLTYQVTNLIILESFPVQIGVTMEIVNGSPTSRSQTFPDGCVVLMRAYDDGADPVWDMGGSVACTLALVEVDLAPGETQVFQTSLVSAATILGDRLPNGEYRITAYLRPGQTVELEAGRVDLAVP